MNALITLTVIAVLAFIGFLIRLTQGDPVRTPLTEQAGLYQNNAPASPVRSEVQAALAAGRVEMPDFDRRRGVTTENARIVNRKLVHTVATNPMINRAEIERFEVLVGCEVLSDRDNSGSRIWLSHQGREFVGHLYFATTPDPALEPKAIADIGGEAWRTAKQLLQTRTSRVFTRWHSAGERGHYMVMIYIEGSAGADRRFLSEILVANGLADYQSLDMILPDGRTHSSAFVRKLAALEQAAQQARRGAWGLDHPRERTPAIYQNGPTVLRRAAH